MAKMLRTQAIVLKDIPFTRINLVLQKHGNKDLQLRPTTKTNTNLMSGSTDGQLS